MGGSIVIARYLGEEFGLAGSNAFENAEIAAIADWISEYFTELVRQYLGKMKQRKLSCRRSFAMRELKNSMIS